jgi:hypothetical protein
VDVGNPALSDLVGLPIEGLQVSLKDLAHQLGIFDGLELGEAQVHEGPLGAHGVFPVSWWLILGLSSQRDRELPTVLRCFNTSAQR